MRIYKIGDSIHSMPMHSIPAGKGFKKLDLSEYMRSPVNARDIAERTVFTLGYGFRYRDINDPNLILHNVFQDDFNFRSGSLWGQEAVEVNIAYSKERNHAVIREVDGTRRSTLIALEIKCKKPYLEVENVSGYKGKYAPLREGFLRTSDNINMDEYVWDGYLEENNQWPYFRAQFDDSLFRVKSLQIHPIGHLVLTYEDIEELDNNMLICSAIAMGIILKIPTIYYKFGEDSIYQ